MGQLLRYFWVGSCAALLDLIFFLLFHNALGLNYLVVGIVGFILATLLNYLLSVHWVFTSGIRFGRRLEIASVYGVSLVGLALHALVLFTLVGTHGCVATCRQGAGHRAGLFLEFFGPALFCLRTEEVERLIGRIW